MTEKDSAIRSLKTRPLATLGSVFLLTAFLLSFFNSNLVTFIITIAAIILTIFTLIFHRKRKSDAKAVLAVTVSAALSILLFFCYTARYNLNIEKYADNIYPFKGRVTEVEYSKNGSYKLTVRLNEHPFTELPNSVNAHLFFKGDENLPNFYDEISFKAVVLAPLNSSEFDMEEYNKQRKISCSLYLREKLNVENKANGFFNWVKQFRERANDRITSLYTEENGRVVSSILLGYDKLPYDVEMYGRLIGISHIFVLSGLHIGLLSHAVFYLCSKMFRLNRRKSSIISAIVIWMFVFMTGFRISAVRAGIMFSMFLLAGLFNRKNDSFTSLIFAGTVITIMNPLAAASPSFVLSFSATLGVIELTGSVYEENSEVSKTLRNIYQIFAMSISSTIALLPFLIYYFEGFSVIGIILNIIIIPLTELLMIIAAISLVPPFGFLATVGNLVSAVLIRLIKDFGSRKLCYFGMNYDLVKAAVPVLFVLVLLLIIKKRQKCAWLIVTSIVLIVVISFTASYTIERNTPIEKDILSDETLCRVQLSGDAALVKFKSLDKEKEPDIDSYAISSLNDYLISKNVKQVIIANTDSFSKFEEYRVMRKLFTVIEINDN